MEATEKKTHTHTLERTQNKKQKRMTRKNAEIMAQEKDQKGEKREGETI